MRVVLSFAAGAATALALPATATTIGPFDIFFDSGSRELSKFARPILDAAADAIAAYPDSHLLISGHTDAAGSRELNDRLSCTRALAARTYLLSKGVSAERLTVVGYGEVRPLVTTPDGVREIQNRRVEVRLMGPSQVADAAAGARRC